MHWLGIWPGIPRPFPCTSARSTGWGLSPGPRHVPAHACPGYVPRAAQTGSRSRVPEVRLRAGLLFADPQAEGRRDPAQGWCGKRESVRDAARSSAPARPPPPPLLVPPPVCPCEGSCRHGHHRLSLRLRCRLGPAPTMAQILPIRFQEHFQVRSGLRRRDPAGYRAGLALRPVSRAPSRPASRGTGREPLTGRPPRPPAPGPGPRLQWTRRGAQTRAGRGGQAGGWARRPVQWEGAVARTCRPARCAGR